ncbi:hypothetical protein LTR36_005879 [Oleoguttula mirabilis]|uniref:Uncharacterized protein n=1 Tax=Oleoguttula mirabilis TaxID=1507867 RepID=A0AAV9JE58_9PEZI|nr:hypothetical protein LTR36_005879 [Oleoguttula mirabilis]
MVVSPDAVHTVRTNSSHSPPHPFERSESSDDLRRTAAECKQLEQEAATVVTSIADEREKLEAIAEVRDASTVDLEAGRSSEQHSDTTPTATPEDRSVHDLEYLINSLHLVGWAIVFACLFVMVLYFLDEQCSSSPAAVFCRLYIPTWFAYVVCDDMAESVRRRWGCRRLGYFIAIPGMIICCTAVNTFMVMQCGPEPLLHGA